MSKKTETIYVALIDEGVDVWRPVKAERLEGQVFRILEQEYDPEIETWAFSPGEKVWCEEEARSVGRVWVAKKTV